MSVIRYVSEEEVDEETSGEKQEEVFNETIMQRPPKVRVAICGPARAGKTFVLNAIEQSYLERFDNPLRHYMHLNKILFDEETSKFEFADHNSAVQTRDYLANCGCTKANYLRHCLEELNDYDLILVEDLRHKWEFDVLKEHNFVILYISTPSDVRFKRAKDLYDVNFMWSTHEQRLSDIKYHPLRVTEKWVEVAKDEKILFDEVFDHNNVPSSSELWDTVVGNKM